MPVTVDWDNAEQTVLRLEIDGRWSFDEFEAVTNAARDMVKNTPHQNVVGYLTLIGRDFHFPYDILNISRYNLMTKNPRMVSVVIVTDHPVAKAFYGALKRLLRFGNNIVDLVGTEGEGRVLIIQRLQERQQVIDLQKES